MKKLIKKIVIYYNDKLYKIKTYNDLEKYLITNCSGKTYLALCDNAPMTNFPNTVFRTNSIASLIAFLQSDSYDEISIQVFDYNDNENIVDYLDLIYEL